MTSTNHPATFPKQSRGSESAIKGRAKAKKTECANTNLRGVDSLLVLLDAGVYFIFMNSSIHVKHDVGDQSKIHPLGG